MNPKKASFPEYSVWRGIRRRCLCPTNKMYSYYGGRGITICRAWNSFEAFLSDVGPRPTSKHTIERINMNGNYEPGNCRWATRKEQANNRRSNVIYELHGEKKTQAAWAKELGVSSDLLIHRLKIGWSLEDALTTPRMEKYVHAGV